MIFFLPGNEYDRIMKIINEAEMPNIFGSRLKGKSTAIIVNTNVVAPPTSIAQNAPIVLLFRQKNAPITGTNSPLTIKAYE